MKKLKAILKPDCIVSIAEPKGQEKGQEKKRMNMLTRNL